MERVQPIEDDDDAWQPKLPGVIPRRVAGWPAVVDAFLEPYRGHTLASYRTDLRQWTEWCARHDIEPLQAHKTDLQRYVTELQDVGRKASTVGRKMAAIRGAYRWADDEDLLEARNPARGVKTPKVDKDSPRRGVDEDELRTIIGLARAAGSLEYALVLLLGLDGLRITEVCTSDVTDMARLDGVRVLGVLRKGDKTRLQPLTAPVAAAVDEHVGRRSRGALLERNGQRLDRKAAWRIIKELGRAAGVPPPGISPHSLRHGFATLAKKYGVALEHVQDAMDHESPDTTRRYDRARHQLEHHPAWTLTEALGDLFTTAAPADDDGGESRGGNP